MSRIKILVSAIVFVTLMFCSTAFSVSTKVDLSPVKNSAGISASGHILFNYIKQRNKTIMQVDCWDLQGATEYTVWGLDAKGKYKKLDSFTTNSSGSGSVNYICSGKLKYTTIYIASGGDSFEMSNVVLVGKNIS